MPRIRQLAKKYAAKDAKTAKEAFQRAIGMQSDKVWFPSSRKLEPEFDVTRSTICSYRKNPEAMPVSAMQRFIELMKPDISVVLKFLGYSDKEIRAFAKQKA